MKTISTLLLSFLLVACGGAADPAGPAEPAPAASADVDDPSCPVAVPGTSVTVEDTNTGAALVFVTTGDVAELRRRVATLASMHNDLHAAMGPLPTGEEQGGGHDHAGHGAHGGGDHAGHGAHAGGDHAGHAGGMIGVHSKAVVEDLDGGARVVFIAFPDGVAAIQGELRTHARHLASGTCQMAH